LVTLRALCPWIYEIEYRENLYPHIQEQAVCRCTNCTTYDKNPLNITENYKCMPIYILEPVLVKNYDKECKDGFFQYDEMLEKKCVGCVCGDTSTSINPVG